LVRNTRDPLQGLSRSEFEARLVSAVSSRTEQLWLFGSYVTRKLTPESDVDVILVTPTAAATPFPLRSRAFEDLLDLGPRLDLLVYTPAEFADLTTDPTVGFWQNVTTSMVRLV
jgi:predicted nucleotidyltransferase